MDDISPDDWAKYGGGGGGYGGYSSPKGKEEEDEEEGMSLYPKQTRHSDFVLKKRKNTNNGYYGNHRGREEDDDLIQKEIHREPVDTNKLFAEAGWSTGFNTPIQESISNKRIIPYDTRHGAALLLNAYEGKEVNFSREMVAVLQKLADCDDEFTEVDPKIVIYDQLSTGTCTIYVEEVVPVSILLLARYFNLAYSITITEDMESKPRYFRDVKTEPPQGRSTQFKNIQGLGCAEAVKRAVRKDEQWKLIQIYMIRMGAQSPQSILEDPDWLETQTRAIGNVLNREQPKHKEVLIGTLKNHPDEMPN